MPIYEYKCGSCEGVFTVMQKMGDGPEGLSCPGCKGKELTKLISRTTTPESVKSMPSSMEADMSRMGGMGGMGGGCPSGSCGSGMCGM